MNVALVHDYLVEAGGAERAVLELHRLFPQAPIYTAVYNPSTTFEDFAECDVRVAGLLRPFSSSSRYKLALPLYPLGFQRFDLSRYDLVVSSASAFAKAVRVAQNATHVCYCYTPPRFVWYLDDYREREGLRGGKAQLVRALRRSFKRVDLKAAQRVTRFVAISRVVQSRIAEAYGREADVVYPPVALERFRLSRMRSEHFLIVSRLNRYKRIDIAIEAFNRLSLPLLIAGTGPDEPRLRSLLGPTVRLLGRVSDDQLSDLYSRAHAVVIPGEEDLGLVPLEANACGRPAIALGRGGARETVVHGVTGILYPDPTVDALVDAVAQLQALQIHPDTLRAHAERFSVEVFRNGMLHAIEAARRA